MAGITDCFGYQCGTPGMSCFTNREASPVSIEAVTECKLLQIPGNALLPLLQEYPQLLWIYNEPLQDVLRSHWKMKTMIYQHMDREHYQWFTKTYSELVKKVSDKNIAFFFGTNSVILSRLKRALWGLSQRNGQNIWTATKRECSYSRYPSDLNVWWRSLDIVTIKYQSCKM